MTMMRFRRYRIFLVFAVIIALLVVRMLRNGDWNGSPKSAMLDWKPPVPPPAKPEGSLPEGAPGPGKAVPESTQRPAEEKVWKPETEAKTKFNPASKAAVVPTKPTTTALQHKTTGVRTAEAELEEDEEVLGAAPRTTAAAIRTPVPSLQFDPDSSIPKGGLPDRTGRKYNTADDDELDDSGIEDLHPVPAGRQSVPSLPPAPTTIHWERQKEHFPVPSESLIRLPTGVPKSIPKIQYTFAEEDPEARARREKRQDIVKQEFAQAWEGYSTYAWLHDELKPVSGGFKDPFCGWAATLVDSLDTLWIMGLYDEFEAAVEGLKQLDFTTSPRADIPMFETTIRYLGGLIAAYDVSGGKYTTILDKAVELAEVLIGAFDTPNRMPVLYYNWKPAFASQPHRANKHSNLAELGSMSMEFTRLAQLTDEPKYYDAVARVTNALEEYQNRGTPLDGVFPDSVDASGCNRTVIISKPIGVSVNHTITPVETVGYTPDEDDLLEEDEADEGDVDAPLKKTEEPTTEHGELPEAKVASSETKEKPHQPEKKIAARQLDYAGNTGGAKDEKVLSSSDTVSPDSTSSEMLKNSPKGKISSTESIVSKVEEKKKNKSSDDELEDCEPKGLDSNNNGADKFSMGGSQDSTYEYFSKQYLLLGGLEEKYHTMYLKTMNAVRKWMIFRPMLPDDRDVLVSGMITTSTGGKDPRLSAELTHLTCFLGGMVGMGAKIFGLEDDMEIAKKLTDGCVWAYEVTPTGIMPEFSTLVPCEDIHDCTWNQTAYYLALDPQGDSRDLQIEKYYENLKFRKEAEQKARIAAVEQAEKDLAAAKEALESAKDAVAAAEAAEAAELEDDEDIEDGEEAQETLKEGALTDTKQQPKETAKASVHEHGIDEEHEYRMEGQKATEQLGTQEPPAAGAPSTSKSYSKPSKRDMGLPGMTGEIDYKASLVDEGQRGDVPTEPKKESSKMQVVEPSKDTKPTPVDKIEEPTKTKSKSKGKGKKKATLAPDPLRPLSHKEYVEQRIEQSALPPGFFAIHDRRYILRPEAIESVWYMYRITGDTTWQDKGWQMFESIIAATKSEYGHSAIGDVTSPLGSVRQLDAMESFWLAETLKYFYLLFSTPDVISLDDWVLNTEAHPFKRPAPPS